MIPEIGSFSLILTLCITLLGWIYSFRSNLSELTVDLRKITIVCFLGISISYICLTYSFSINDFSVEYVARLSSSLLPINYRLTAVWGGHEGSMLLWVWFLGLWIFSLYKISNKISYHYYSQIHRLLSFILLFFLIFIICTSDPFIRILPIAPVEGQELNPLLQDIGFIIHPPLLYLGYVGLTVVYALGVAGYQTDGLSRQTAVLIKPYLFVAWSFLTLGITLGSWWAYRELGWGGFWFWDPVENSSLLPWLSATMLLHMLTMYIKKGIYRYWVIFLIMITFVLSLLATFLVRSGLLTSVHAFANDPKRGLFLLVLIAIMSVYSCWTFLRFYKTDKAIHFQLISKESLILINSILLLVLLLSILLGTFYPLLIDFIGSDSVSIGPGYFNTVLQPLIFPILFLMGLVHVLISKHLNYKNICMQLILSCSLSVFLLYFLYQKLYVNTLFGVTLGVWILISGAIVFYQGLNNRLLGLISKVPMLLAHIGFGLLAIGVTVVSYYSVEKNVQMSLGNNITIGPYDLIYQDDRVEEDKNYISNQVYFQIVNQNHVLIAEKRAYKIAQMIMTDAGIAMMPLGDIYIALGEAVDLHTWTLRVQYKPLIRLVWLGGILMALSCIAFLWNKRKRSVELS